MMAYVAKLELQFLSDDAQIILYDGKPLNKIPANLLFLLAYLVVNGSGVYARNELQDRLGWDKREKLNNNLFLLREYLAASGCLALPPQEAKTSDAPIIFDRAHVLADSDEFLKRATELLSRSKHVMDPKTMEQIYDTLHLYKGHLLGKVKFNKNSKAFWLVEQREKLANLRHQLMDRLVRFHIVHGQLDEAKTIAETWLNSLLKLSYQPLQYLIWIGIKQDRLDEVQNHYLRRLRTYELETNDFPINPNTATWFKLIAEKAQLTLELIDIHPHSAWGQLRALPHHYVKDTALRDYLCHLLLDPHGPPVIGLVGQSGIGKTLLAQLVIDALCRQRPQTDLAWLDLRPEIDLDLLLDDVLTQLKLTHLLSLESADKRKKFQKEIQSSSCVIVLDEGATGKLASPEMQNQLVSLFEGARLVLVAQDLGDNTYYEHSLSRFDDKLVRAYLAEHATQFNKLRDSEIRAIKVFTDGIPLALHLVAGGLKKKRIEFMTFIQAHIAETQVFFEDQTQALLESQLEAILDGKSVYRHILDWQWDLMTPAEKAVLYATTLFDYRVGCTETDLSNLIPDFSVVKIHSILESLLITSFVTQDKSQDNYHVHPLLAEIIRTYELESSPLSLEEITTNYLSYMISVATAHANDFNSLDRWRYDLLNIFQLVLSGSKFADFRQKTLAVLVDVCSYFDRRGLYSMVRELCDLAFSSPNLDEEVSVQLSSRLGQISLRQNGFPLADEYFANAHNFALRAENDELYALTIRDFGISALRKGDYYNARIYLEKGAKLTQENHPILFAQMRVNLARIYYDEGNLAAAAELSRAIEADLTSAVDPLPYAAHDILQFITNLQGSIALADENYEVAKQAFTRSMVAARLLNNPDRIARVNFNIASALYYQGNVVDADYYFKLGEVVAEHQQNNELLVWAWWNRAALLAYQKKYDEGRKLLNKALVKAQQLELVSEYAHIWFTAGILNLHQERPKTAIQYFVKTLKIEKASLWTKALALYGIGVFACYSHLVEIIGQPEMVYERIVEGIQNLNLGEAVYGKVSAKDINRAGTYFRIALPHLLEFGDEEITEGLKRWLANRN